MQYYVGVIASGGIIFLWHLAAVEPFGGPVIALRSRFRVGLAQARGSLPVRECREGA